MREVLEGVWQPETDAEIQTIPDKKLILQL